MLNPFSLKDKTVFVSGASSGIGRAAAIECSKMGAKMCITGRNAERLGITFNMLEGKDHIQIVADLKNDDELRMLSENLPVIDGMVHCAGIGKPVPFQYSGQEIIEEVMKINFTSHALLTHYMLKSKKIAKGASIVFISSISGIYISSAGGAAYSASKSALHGLMKALAIELAPRMIRVNSVNPGMIDTNIYSDGIISQEQLKDDAQKYPLKRYGKPEEVAWAVVYLLSDAASWITGTSLVIDGGYTLL